MRGKHSAVWAKNRVLARSSSYLDPWLGRHKMEGTMVEGLPSLVDAVEGEGLDTTLIALIQFPSMRRYKPLRAIQHMLNICGLAKLGVSAGYR